MKRFLVNITFFLSIIIIIMAILISGTYFVLQTISFKIPNDRYIIIVGDSHTECAIDDSIFSHSINMSQSGEAYFYSYIKLRRFIDVNPHIDKVILSFHGSSISKSREDRWVKDNKYILNRVPKYISLFHKEDIDLLINKTIFFVAVLRSPMYSIMATLKTVFHKNVTYKDINIGGYLKLDRDKLAINLELQNTDMELGEDTEDIQDEYPLFELPYLSKIVDLCREKNVELILLNSPTYNSEKYGNKISLTQYYNNYLSGVKYLDFSDFVLPEYGYGDIGHLNYKGAEIFSRYLENNYEIIF
jgi:Ni,Fe-hydrogenase III small subunit